MFSSLEMQHQAANSLSDQQEQGNITTSVAEEVGDDELFSTATKQNLLANRWMKQTGIEGFWILWIKRDTLVTLERHFKMFRQAGNNNRGFLVTTLCQCTNTILHALYVCLQNQHVRKCNLHMLLHISLLTDLFTSVLAIDHWEHKAISIFIQLCSEGWLHKEIGNDMPFMGKTPDISYMVLWNTLPHL